MNLFPQIANLFLHWPGKISRLRDHEVLRSPRRAPYIRLYVPSILGQRGWSDAGAGWFKMTITKTARTKLKSWFLSSSYFTIKDQTAKNHLLEKFIAQCIFNYWLWMNYEKYFPDTVQSSNSACEIENVNTMLFTINQKNR